MASEAILHDNLFDGMNSLVDELFEAEDIAALKAFGKDVWRSIKKEPEAPNVTVIVFNRIQAALDCLKVVEDHRSRGIHVSKYSGRTLDCRSPRAKAIQDGIDGDEEVDQSHKAIVRREMETVIERAKNFA